jgi:hypothetical protein
MSGVSSDHNHRIASGREEAGVIIRLYFFRFIKVLPENLGPHPNAMMTELAASVSSLTTARPDLR